MRQKTQNLLLLSLGWVFVALGFIGVLLPIMPTTPFLIVAAACFSRGSPRLHSWLLNQKHVGPALRSWEEHRVISPKSKALSTALIAFSLSWPIIFVPVDAWVKISLATIGVAVIAFILTRKSYPESTSIEPTDGACGTNSSK